MNKSITKHANKVGHGLSAAALMFLYATFATKDSLLRHEDKEASSRSKVWQRLMDHEVSLAKINALSVTEPTNSIASIP